MFVPLRIFEQTCPCARELLFHYLDNFVSPSGWTHSGFQRFFEKPSPYVHDVFLRWGLCSRCVLMLCFCDETNAHAVFSHCVLRWGLPSSCRNWLWQILLASHLDEQILATSDSLQSLHLFLCYALATMIIYFHGSIGSGTALICTAHHTSTTKRVLAKDCFIQL